MKVSNGRKTSTESLSLKLFVALAFILGEFMMEPQKAFSNDEKELRDTGMVCAIDMGSNTLKLIIAEIKNGEYRQYLDDRKTIGVGDDLRKSEMESGRKIISESKGKEILSLLTAFQDECKRKTGSRKIYGIATAAFREAENGPVIAEELHKQDVDVKILSTEEESIYAYEASTLGEPGLAVVDLGSRTTEFVSRAESGPYQWVALPIGYKTAWDDFYEKADTFGQASTEHLKKLSELVREQEEKILVHHRQLKVIEVGETASYVLGIAQNQIEGKVVTHSQVQNKLKELHAMDKEYFADLKKTFKDAAKVLPRLVFLDLILKKTGYEEFYGTNRELNVAIVYRISHSGS